MPFNQCFLHATSIVRWSWHYRLLSPWAPWLGEWEGLLQRVWLLFRTEDPIVLEVSVVVHSRNLHYTDVIMGMMASQITSLTIVCWTVYSRCRSKIKHQSSASLAFVRGIHRWLVYSLHTGPVTQKMFPFDDVIMWLRTVWQNVQSCLLFPISTMEYQLDTGIASF